MNKKPTFSHFRTTRVRTTLSLLLLGTWGLTGCSMMPAYERPASPVGSHWAVADTASAAQAAEPTTPVSWKHFYQHAPLQELIALALSNNRDLRVAVLNVEKVRAQWQIQRANRYPTLNAVAGVQRISSTEDRYSAGLQVSGYEVDLFGRVASLSESALAQYLSTEEARKAVHISLIGAVANAWLNVVADKTLMDLSRETLRNREESLRLIQLSYEQGVRSELDFRQAQFLVDNARATLLQQQRQWLQDQNALTLLVGAHVPESLRDPVNTRLSQINLPDVPAGIPSQVLIQRPDVLQAEQRLKAANANIGAARAAFFPNITLTAGVGTASSSLSELFKDGAWTLVAQAVMPLFDAGRNQANLEVAQLTRDMAVADYEKAIQTAFREVSDGLAARATLGDQLQAFEAQTLAQTRSAELAQLRYDNGLDNYQTFLNAQINLFTAQQLQVQTRLAQLQNQVRLYAALGGGWTEDDDRSAKASDAASATGNEGKSQTGLSGASAPASRLL